MNEEFNKLIEEYNQVMCLQKFNEDDLDYSILDYHIKLLNTVNEWSKSLISIFDINKKEHIYLSSQFENVLGWNLIEAKEQGNDYFNSRTHPEDMFLLTKSGIYFMNFAFNTPIEERKNFKLLSDYRVKDGSGKYVRVVEQRMLLESDKNGNMWLALGILDISPDNDVTSLTRNRMLNIKTGDLFVFPPKIESKKDTPKLSDREKEILKHIAGGLISKEIADKLFISVNTVNTHRQRILEKLNVSNTYEAVKYAGNLGILY